MKKSLVLLFLGFFLINTMVALAPNAAAPNPKGLTKKEIRKAEKTTKKEAKLKKKMKKLEKKLAKKGYAAAGSVWEDDTFRLGALIALGGLVIRLFAFLPFIGGIISLIGTLILLLGIGIMIWVLIDG